MLHSQCMGINYVQYINVDSKNIFSFQPVLHDWCNKSRGVCYPVRGMLYIK